MTSAIVHLKPYIPETYIQNLTGCKQMDLEDVMKCTSSLQESDPFKNFPFKSIIFTCNLSQEILEGERVIGLLIKLKSLKIHYTVMLFDPSFIPKKSSSQHIEYWSNFLRVNKTNIRAFNIEDIVSTLEVNGFNPTDTQDWTLDYMDKIYAQYVYEAIRQMASLTELQDDLNIDLRTFIAKNPPVRVTPPAIDMATILDEIRKIIYDD